MARMSTEPCPLPVLVLADPADSAPATFAMWGLRPMVVHHLEDALRLLGEQAFRAVVLDLDLPDIDALMLVTAIRSHRPISELPIFAMGSAAHDARELAEQRGCDHVFGAHGRDPDVLAAEVEAALAHPRRAHSMTAARTAA